MGCPQNNRELCEYRLAEVNRKLDELHNDVKDLHKTVRNGISEKISECHTKLETHSTHIVMHWWFIGGMLTAIGAITVFVAKRLFA